MYISKLIPAPLTLKLQCACVHACAFFKPQRPKHSSRRKKIIKFGVEAISHFTYYLLSLGSVWSHICEDSIVWTAKPCNQTWYGYACPGTRVIHTQMCPTRLPLPWTRQNIYQLEASACAICHLSAECALGLEHSKPVFRQNIIARNNVRAPKTLWQTRRGKTKQRWCLSDLCL